MNILDTFLLQTVHQKITYSAKIACLSTLKMIILSFGGGGGDIAKSPFFCSSGGMSSDRLKLPVSDCSDESAWLRRPTLSLCPWIRTRWHWRLHPALRPDPRTLHQNMHRGQLLRLWVSDMEKKIIEKKFYIVKGKQPLPKF